MDVRGVGGRGFAMKMVADSYSNKSVSVSSRIDVSSKG